MPVPAQKGNALRDLRVRCAAARRIAAVLLALAAAGARLRDGT